MIKRIRIKKLGVSCGIVSLGEDEPEVYSQGNMIYINQDHKIYKNFMLKRLIQPSSAATFDSRNSYDEKNSFIGQRSLFWQSRLLKDTLN